MRRIAALPLVLVVVLAVGSQLAIPAITERQVERRLERRGGSARVSLSALPALRLLLDDGDSLVVKGSGLRLEPGRGGETLERIDGFDEVSVSLEQLEAGPLEIHSFMLVRDEGERDYSVRILGETSARRVGRFLGTRAGGPFGGLLGDLAAGSLPGGGTVLPLDFRATVESRESRLDTSEVRGSVAGLPAGPLAEIAIDAVARRL